MYFPAALLPVVLLCPIITCSQSPAPAQTAQWYKDAIIYSVDVKTFKDSDGDGNGDFDGLTGKLGYISSLGINTIWLAPFQPSPLEDDGYDITDYYAIDARVGNQPAFTRFLDSCHQRRIRVIMDLVLDHTSDKHPWFLRSAAKDRQFHNWYFWQKSRPVFADSGVAFPGVQKETWTYNKEENGWYFHRFYDFQPHLNFYLPAVRETAKKIMQFWLAKGIDGFRVDAVPFMIEKPDPEKDTAYQLFSYIPVMHQVTANADSTAILLGEANVPPSQLLKYTGKNGQGLQMMFNFYVNQFLFYALASGDVSPLRQALAETRVPVSSFQWVNFLRNHDEVDLGRLSPAQQALAFQTFGPDKSMQLYSRGIRRRLAPMLDNSRKKMELAYSLAAALPGAFMIRSGEELGMGDDPALKERLAVRTPMQWDSTTSGGFTSGPRPIRPVITGGEYGFEKLNAKAESLDSNSLLTWMQQLVRIRKENPEMAEGTCELADSSQPGVLSLIYTHHGKKLLVVENVTRNATTLVLDAGLFTDGLLKPLFHQSETIPSNDNRYTLTIPALGYEWYSVEHK